MVIGDMIQFEQKRIKDQQKQLEEQRKEIKLKICKDKVTEQRPL